MTLIAVVRVISGQRKEAVRTQTSVLFLTLPVSSLRFAKIPRAPLNASSLPPAPNQALLPNQFRLTVKAAIAVRVK